MKTLLLTFFLASTLTHAAPPQQWITDPPNGTTYLKRHLCPGECVPLVQDGTLVDLSVSVLQDVEEPDGTFRKVDARNCADSDSCQAELAEMSCSSAEPIYAEKAGGGFEAYCPEPRMRTVRKFVEDPSKKAERAAAMALQEAKAHVLKRMSFGREMIAGLAVRNVQKGLSVGQRRQVRKNLNDIKDALEAGALEDARKLITELTPDGTLVTAADVAWALAAIDEFLAAE